MTPAPAEPPSSEGEQVDLLVIGSGAGGLAAAISAAHRGLRVMVVEKEPHFGGTTAWSGGWMWIPGNPLVARTDAERDSAIERASAYLLTRLGDADFFARLPKIAAYLQNGPRMLQFFQGLTNAPMAFDVDRETPDFHDDVSHGRAVRAQAISSAELGTDDFRSLRPPLRTLTMLGMGIEAGDDLADTLRMMRPPWPERLASGRRVGRRLLGYALGRLGHWQGSARRGVRLVNGNALVAQMLRAARQFENLSLHHSTRAVSLIFENGMVRGARVDGPDGVRTIRSGRGVVLACGGFPHDAHRWKRLAPRSDLAVWSAAPVSNDGDGLHLAESVGGVCDTRLAGGPAVWAPVSLLPRKDSSTGVYPHFVERAKPGVIAVNRAGRRFANEAVGYDAFVRNWLEVTPHDQPLEAWLICDATFVARYGLGAAKPWPVAHWPRLHRVLRRTPLWSFRRSGYIKDAASVEALASACGIDPEALRDTVERYNRSARQGSDPDFHRGETAYEGSQGDPLSPAKCVAPIEKAPFFALRLHPGSLGTFAGLETLPSGAVVDRAGKQIPGLYACGNDMAAPMGGFYPASGLTLGAAMTFGYVIGSTVSPLPTTRPASPASAAIPAGTAAAP